MVIWTYAIAEGGVLLGVAELATLLAALAAVWLVMRRRWGWSFVATTVIIAGMVLTIFSDLYPNVMVSSLDPANNLTIDNTSSAPYSLKVMTVVVAIFLPGVLAYQGWTYHVFRKRVTASQ